MKFYSKKTFQLDKSIINQILNLKDSYWKFGIKSQRQFFLNNIKNNNPKDVLLISKVFQNISFLSYLLQFYKKYFFERFEMIFSQSQNYKEKYRYFSNKICWEVFFYCTRRRYNR